MGRLRATGTSQQNRYHPSAFEKGVSSSRFVVSSFFHSCQFRGNSLTRMYRVAGLKCLTHIYTGFHTSRDKGSLMKLLPLDLRFPKSKLSGDSF